MQSDPKELEKEFAKLDKLHALNETAMLRDKKTIGKLKMKINNLRQKLKSKKGETHEQEN